MRKNASALVVRASRLPRNHQKSPQFREDAQSVYQRLITDNDQISKDRASGFRPAACPSRPFYRATGLEGSQSRTPPMVEYLKDPPQ